MRYIIFAGFILAAAPAFAQSQTPGPTTSTQRHEASRDFSDAGGSASQTARDTGHGLEHGWQVTKKGVAAGWNKVTGDDASTK